jgi:hypothetical protein
MRIGAAVLVAIVLLLPLAALAHAGPRHGCHHALYGWPYADAKDREIRTLCRVYRCRWAY